MHTAVPSAGNSDPEPLQIDIGIKEVAALTTEEKLQHFEDICTGDALKKYEQAVSDYTAYEEKILNEHKENARKQAALQIAAEKERIARETNKNLSLGQIEIRRSYSRKDEELRGKVFSELRDRLARFMETPKYDALLEAQIKKEKAFAGSSEIHIYIDPSDREKQNLLSLRTDCDIRVSQYPFLGGTRAVIASKNILIDNSFETKLKEAEQGNYNSFYFAEEVLSTYSYKQLIKANDRATLLNLMVGLNGYTLCSGILCDNLNGSDYWAVKLKSDEVMTIGYLKRKGIALSPLGQKYLEEIRKFEGM